MRFFAGSVKEFFEDHINLTPMSNPIPFGSGPWICVDNKCEKYIFVL